MLNNRGDVTSLPWIQVWISWVYALLAFFSLWPFVSWKWPVMPLTAIVISYCMVTFDFFIINKCKILPFKFILFLFLSIGSCFFLIYPGGLPPWFNYYSIFLVLLLLLPVENIQIISNNFRTIFVFSLIPGLFIYFLLAVGFKLPFSILDAHNELKDTLGIYYRDYGATIALSHLIVEYGGGELIRFSGMLDEPGLLGTVCALLLLADKCDIKRPSNIILLISGILSISLVFYILMVVGWVAQSRNKSKILFLLSFVGFFVYYSPLYENFLAKRINPEDGVVDNRVSECFQSFYDKFLSSDAMTLFLGNGNNAHIFTGCDVSSYKMYIYDYGYVGVLFLVLLLCVQYITPLIGRGDFFSFIKSNIVFLGAFIISYYQRPVLFSLSFTMIFIYCYNRFIERGVK
ncbi:hypothetical protein [Buttiauxella gaviniae]|uniref:hypothetical protein n=1 Tax=Buttiauxella gaviniae TaxID=82990 RepID=UPI0039AEC1C1